VTDDEHDKVCHLRKLEKEPVDDDNNEPPKWMVVAFCLVASVGLMTIGYWAVILFDKFLSWVEGT